MGADWVHIACDHCRDARHDTGLPRGCKLETGKHPQLIIIMM